MQFQESHEGDYRIYVGALEAPRGDGYIAAVVVNRVRGVPGPAASARPSATTAWPAATAGPTPTRPCTTR